MNTEQLIKDLLSQDEGEQLEFQGTLRKDAIGKNICAFLNNEGGQILVGVGSQKEIIGVPNAGRWKDEIKTYLLSELVPEAPVMVSLESYNDKDLILIKVWTGSKQPYIFDGSIYYRKGPNTVKASSYQISELIHNRQVTEIHWERQPSIGAVWEDLDLDEIYNTMESARSENKMKDNKQGPMDFLTYYGLYQNGYFTNAAIALFAKEPALFIPQVRVRIAFLSEGKIGSVYQDDKLLDGNIFKNLIAIEAFFERNLGLMSSFSENDWQRKDSYIIPMSALREGVLNALVHRDYSRPSASTSILLYPDKLEITNSGDSPLTASEFKKNHLSMPVNPDIAHLVFLRGYIEKMGRGTLKIIETCKKAGLKAPVWNIDKHTVKLTFFSKQIADRTFSTFKNDNLHIAINQAFPELSDVVRNRLIIISRFILDSPGTKTTELLKRIDISERVLKDNIKTLINGELITYEGSKKTGGYFPTKSLQKVLPQ